MYNCNLTGNSETLGRRNTENLRTGLNRKVEGNVKRPCFTQTKESALTTRYITFNDIYLQK